MRSETKQSYKERILTVLTHIQSHLDDELSLNDLACMAHFSPYHFHRIFRGMVGESVMEHIRRLRLERAAHRLKMTDDAIMAIAFEAGYETHEAFTRAFRAMFGAAPSTFRKNHRKLMLSEAPTNVHFHPEGKLNDFTPLDTGGRFMEVHIEYVPSIRIAYLSHTGPYNTLCITRQQLHSWAQASGIINDQTLFISIYYDDPETNPAETLRSDACISIQKECSVEGEIKLGEIEAGEYAVASYCGSPERLAEMWARFYGEWLPASGHEPRAAKSFEVFRNYSIEKKPETAIIDLYAPVEPKL